MDFQGKEGMGKGGGVDMWLSWPRKGHPVDMCLWATGYFNISLSFYF